MGQSLTDRERTITTWSVLGLAAAAIAYVLWAPNHLYLVDYPQHLGIAAAIHGRNDPIWSQFYSVDLGRSQYLFMYLFTDVFAHVLPLEQAARLYVALFLGATPLAVGYLMKVHGRPAIYGLGSIAPIFCLSFAWGWLPFLSSLPIAFLGLAALARFTQQPSWKTALGYSLIATVCFYTHAIGFSALALGSLVQTLAMAPRYGWKRLALVIGVGLLCAIPSVVGIWIWFEQSNFLDVGHLPRGNNPNRASGDLKWADPADTLRWIYRNTFGIYQDNSGGKIAGLFTLMVLGIASLRGIEKDSKAPPNAPKHTWAPEALVLALLALYLFGPHAYKLVSPLNTRMINLFLFLVPVLGPWRLPSRWAHYGCILLMSTVGLYALNVHHEHLADMDEEVGQFDEALAKTDPGKRLMGFPLNVGTKITNKPAYLHVHQHYQSNVGGLASYGFAELPMAPITYKEGAAPKPFVMGVEWGPFWGPRSRFRYDRYADYFDYYLVRRHPNQRLPEALFGGKQPPPNKIFESPQWVLFEKNPSVREPRKK